MSAPRRRRPPAWVLVAAAVALGFLPGWWRGYLLHARAARLEAEIAALTRENQRLLAEMTQLQQDPLYLERIARKKLGKTRPNEMIYKVGPPPDSSQGTR